jgi:hypothetical protein
LEIKADGEEGGGVRGMNADGFANLLPSSTRAGTACLRPDVPRVDLASLIFGCTFEKKENTAQLSTGTIAAQAVCMIKNNLEAETKRLLLLLAAEKAAIAAKVFVP